MHTCTRQRGRPPRLAAGGMLFMAIMRRNMAIMRSIITSSKRELSLCFYVMLGLRLLFWVMCFIRTCLVLLLWRYWCCNGYTSKINPENKDFKATDWLSAIIIILDGSDGWIIMKLFGDLYKNKNIFTNNWYIKQYIYIYISTNKKLSIYLEIKMKESWEFLSSFLASVICFYLMFNYNMYSWRRIEMLFRVICVVGYLNKCQLVLSL